MEPMDQDYAYGLEEQHPPMGGDELMYDNGPMMGRKDSRIVRDAEFYQDDLDEMGEATWGEVCQTCCCHTFSEWLYIFVGICILLFFLYFFLLALDLLGASAKVIGGCTAGNLLGSGTNPIAALMIGILVTVLLQSSSTTTSIVVSLVGAGSLGTKQAIYVIMGANIGTSVTNTIVAIGQMGNQESLQRAFAGATVHDMFNFMTVGVLLPVEVLTGYLYAVTKAMVRNVDTREGESWQGPIKQFVGPLANKLIIANKAVTDEVASGASCEDFYPVRCTDEDNPTTTTCMVGLIACDKATNKCPVFFQSTATQKDDEVSGGVCFFLSIVMLVVCLIGLVSILQKMLLGMSTRIIYKATDINGYLAILVGAGITVLVQSSSITTSTLTPLVGMGVLRLEQMYPLTLGANIGTTVTAILAALVADTVDALQVALAHLMFNVTGILIFYPIPFMRRIPLNAARKLGEACTVWRGFPFVYIGVMFFLIPIVFLGLSTLFEQNSLGYTVLGCVMVIGVGGVILFYLFRWQYRGGRESCLASLEHRQKKKESIERLPNDMEYIMAKLTALSEHTGLLEDDEGDMEDDDQ